jgi:aryl-alcohol dehydrogenase-like predicted oxidoreductase
VVPTAQQFGLGVLPYFPLANGLLAGKIRRGVPPAEGTRLAGRDGYITDEKLDIVEAIAEWSQQHGRTMLEVAIGGLAAQPGCSSVIAGATSADQVRANVKAGEWVPEASQLAEIDKITTPAG